MANHVTNHVSYYLHLKSQFKTDLAAIRHWNNLKVGFEGDDIWIKDLDYVQINSVEVQSIPYKTLFYENDGKLFLVNSQLPHANIPSLLWTPINRAFPITLPPLNHNLFEINNTAKIEIIPSSLEQESVGILVSLTHLETFLFNAPTVRLKNLSWCIVNQQALILGKPFLPVNGQSVWQINNHLLPNGYTFNFKPISYELNRILNTEATSYLLWQNNGNYSIIEKENLMPLSISSFKQSINNLLPKT
jgi:hypothetical protein